MATNLAYTLSTFLKSIMQKIEINNMMPADVYIQDLPGGDDYCEIISSTIMKQREIRILKLMLKKNLLRIHGLNCIHTLPGKNIIFGLIWMATS